MKIRRALGPLTVALLAGFLAACRSGPVDAWGSRARTMLLTSGPAEISLSSSRVPGYWAQQVEDGQEFFLYTRARSFEKGSRVRVVGPFGFVTASVYLEDKGLYMRYYRLHVLVVWRMAGDDGPSDRGSAPREEANHARHP